MISVGPIDIDLSGVNFTIDPPVKQQLLGYDRIVINNHSPFLLKIHIGVYSGFVHPFMGDVFPFDPTQGGKVFVEPELMGVTTGNPHHFCAEYYEKDEPIQGPAYPAMMALFATQNAFGSNTLFPSAAITSGQLLTLDVTAFSSFQLRIAWQNGIADTTASLRIDFESGGVLMASERFELISDLSQTLYTSANTIQAFGGGVHFLSGPCLGDTLKISLTFANGTATAQVVASSRQMDKLRCMANPIGAAMNEPLSAQATVTVNAGVTSSKFWGPSLMPGPAWIRVIGTQAYTLSVIFGSSGEVMKQQIAGGSEFATQVIIPRKPCGIQIKNTSGVNGNYNAELVATGD
jgi:hypothetical protein